MSDRVVRIAIVIRRPGDSTPTHIVDRVARDRVTPAGADAIMVRCLVAYSPAWGDDRIPQLIPGGHTIPAHFRIGIDPIGPTLAAMSET